MSMNKLAEIIDNIIIKAIADKKGMISNNELFPIIEKSWPILLKEFPPSPERIGKSMKRLGFQPWRNRISRGWYISL